MEETFERKGRGDKRSRDIRSPVLDSSDVSSRTNNPHLIQIYPFFSHPICSLSPRIHLFVPRPPPSQFSILLSSLIRPYQSSHIRCSSSLFFYISFICLIMSPLTYGGSEGSPVACWEDNSSAGPSYVLPS